MGICWRGLTPREKGPGEPVQQHRCGGGMRGLWGFWGAVGGRIAAAAVAAPVTCQEPRAASASCDLALSE